MIQQIRVSVPGKIILMGEHAAVYDRPALVAALGLRAEVSVSGAPNGEVDLDLLSLGHAESTTWEEILDYRDRRRDAWERYAATPDPERFQEVRGDDPAHIVKIGLGEAMRSLGSAARRPARIVVESELPVGSGFGSSAAVAVGVLAAALRFLGGKAEPERVAALAIEVERCQHGHPSGVDHTTVLRGGILRFEGREGAARKVRSFSVPGWITNGFRVFNTGTPKESTGEVVAGVRESRSEDAAAFEALLDRMEHDVRRLEVCLEEKNPPSSEVRRAVLDFESCLESIGVVPTAVRSAVRRVEEAGGAAKISGAGSLSGDSAGCLLVYWPPALAGAPADLLEDFSLLRAPIGALGLRLEEVV